MFFILYYIFFWGGGVKERRISHFTFSIISFIFKKKFKKQKQTTVKEVDDVHVNRNYHEKALKMMLEHVYH